MSIKNFDPSVYTGEEAEFIQSISAEEWAALDMYSSFADEIVEYMERNGISKADLARRIGKSRSYVTQVLSGSTNISLGSLGKILHALNAELERKIVRKDSKRVWTVHVPKDRRKIQKEELLHSKYVQHSASNLKIDSDLEQVA